MTSRYDATVVDGDELSFTVVFVGENKKHEDELYPKNGTISSNIDVSAYFTSPDG